jgi:hypothetical protein
MDTGTNAIEQVVIGHDELSCHFGMFALGAGVGAILAIAGNVKNRPQLLLQLQRFTHQLFRASVVVDRRHYREGLFAGKKNSFGMAHEVPEQE